MGAVLDRCLRMKVVFILVLPCLALSLDAPDCGASDHFDYADPEACSKFYRCEEGTVTHLQCQADEDGMPRLFDEIYEFCTYTDSVDCGDRPCKDPTACVTQPPKTTESTTPDCGHVMDCAELGQGIQIHITAGSTGTVWGKLGPTTFARMTQPLESLSCSTWSTWAATMRHTLT